MKWSRARFVFISAASSVLLLAAGSAAGAELAAGPVDGSGVIHGCWTNTAINGSHVFVLQDAGTTCPKGTTPISWNQQGPAGPAGPQGPAGPVGATGSQGDTGAEGPAGAAGNTVLNGTGAPTDSLGRDGDFYLDTAADVLYGPKANSTWPATGTSLAGQAGPQGPKGDTGGTGPAGPAGPQGPAGTSLSSLDNLNGTPCNNGQGSTQVGYDSAGAVTIQCVSGSPSPGPSPSPSPSPTNTSPGTATDLGSFACGGLTTGGTIGGTPGAWFKFTWNGCFNLPNPPLEVKLTVTSSTAPGTTGFDLYSGSNLSAPLFTNTTLVDLTDSQTGTYYLNVYTTGGGTSTYTLTLEPLLLV
jgi:hypothetical protein